MTNQNEKTLAEKLVSKMIEEKVTGYYPIHSNVADCINLYKKPLKVYPLELRNSKEGYVFKLVKVIPNTSKKCSERHNSDIAVYQATERIGLDFAEKLIAENEIQGIF